MSAHSLDDNDIRRLIGESIRAVIRLPALETPPPNDLKLFGKAGVLDSLSLVSFVFELEQRIFEAHKIRVTILSDKAFSATQSPLKTVATLSAFIQALVHERG